MAIVGVASVKIKPDLSGFRRELKDGLNAIHADINVKVQADTTKAKAQVEEFVRKESGKDIKKKVDVDKSSLDQASKSLEFFSVKTVGILLSLGAIPGVLQTIIPLVAAMSGGLLLAPGAVLGLVAVLGTVALGVDGINRAFNGLNPTIHKLRDAVSASFEHSLTPAVNNLKVVLPKLKVGFQEIASAIGGAATKFTIMLKSGDNAKILNSVLDGVARIIKNIGNSLAPLGQAFIQIAKIGVDMFVQWTSKIGDTAQHFADFISTAQGIQSVKDKIQGAIDAFKALWDIVKTVLQIVGSVFMALSAGSSQTGGSGLIVFLHEIRDFVQSSGAQDFFKALGAAFSALAKSIGGALGASVQAILPPLTDFLKFVAKNSDIFGPLIVGVLGLKVAFAGLNLVMEANPFVLIAAAIIAIVLAVKGADPVMNAFRNAWKAIQPVLSKIGDVIIPVLKKAWETLKPALDKVIDAIGKLLTALKPVFAAFGSLLVFAIVEAIKIFAGLLTIILNVASFFIDILVVAINAVIDAIKAVVNFFENFGTNLGKILDFFGHIGEAIGKFFSGLAKTVANWAVGVAKDIGNWVTNTAKDFANWSTNTARSIGSWVAGTATDIATWVANTASSIAGWVADTSVSIATWVANTSVSIATWVANTAVSIGTWVANTAVSIGTWVANTSSDFANWVSTNFTALQSWSQNTQAAIGNWVANTAGQIGNWVSNLAGQIGGWVSRTLASIQGWATGVASAIGGAISNTISAVGTWVGNLASTIGGFFSSLPGKIVGWLGNLGGLLVQAGKSIIKGLLDGIVAAAQAVFDFVKSIGRTIASLKGPIPYDLRLLIPAGNAIMKGLKDGLEEGFNPVLQLVQGMAPALQDAFGQTNFGLTSALSSSTTFSASAGTLEALAPVVNVNVDANGGVLKDIIDVRIDEGNRQTRRTALTGGVAFP